MVYFRNIGKKQAPPVTSMLEQMAQKMAKKYPIGFDASGADREGVCLEFMRELANAALDSMMEPTEEILTAGIDEHVERISDHLVRDVVWFQHRAIIRAIKAGK